MAGCTKLTDNVSEIRIEKRESEYFTKTCIFWIEIVTRRCFIKEFRMLNTLLDNQPKVVRNEDIFLNTSNAMV
jgi:hypothetical protein